MDAITLLRADHRSVEKLFKQFEKSSPRARVERQKVVATIIAELSVHAAIEEQLFYPAVRELVPNETGMVLESLEEHHIVKWVLSELEDRDVDDERFEPKVTVLIELVRHHVQEEEGDLFPAVRAAVKRRQLTELGDRMEGAKATVPRRPHPRSPDTPPANAAVAVVTGAVDRVREAVRERIGQQPVPAER
jgi:hemerythrin superfamily protein